MKASYCGNIFGVKSFQSMYYLTDSCMKVRFRVTLAFSSLLTRLHISKLLQRENCVFKKKQKTKKDIVAWFCISFR